MAEEWEERSGQLCPPPIRHPPASRGRTTRDTTEAVRRFGSASAGSRLLNNTMTLREELEAEITDWFGALVGEPDAVVVDEFTHASLRDGLRMARTSVRPFRHNDLGALEEALLAARCRGPDQILVVVDSLRPTTTVRFRCRPGVRLPPAVRRDTADRFRAMTIAAGHRKSRLRPIAIPRCSRSILSATTLTAPERFSTVPRTTSAGADETTGR